MSPADLMTRLIVGALLLVSLVAGAVASAAVAVNRACINSAKRLLAWVEQT